jgi:hypothetical protein
MRIFLMHLFQPHFLDTGYKELLLGRAQRTRSEPEFHALTERGEDMVIGVVAMLRPSFANADQSRLGLQAQWTIDRVCAQFKVTLIERTCLV